MNIDFGDYGKIEFVDEKRHRELIEEIIKELLPGVTGFKWKEPVGGGWVVLKILLGAKRLRLEITEHAMASTDDSGNIPRLKLGIEVALRDSELGLVGRVWAPR